MKNRKNYKRLVSLTTPAILIYGDLDQIIAPYNIPKAVESNPKYLSEKRTSGRHRMSRDKCIAVKEILEEMLKNE